MSYVGDNAQINQLFFTFLEVIIVLFIPDFLEVNVQPVPQENEMRRVYWCFLPEAIYSQRSILAQVIVRHLHS